MCACAVRAARALDPAFSTTTALPRSAARCTAERNSAGFRMVSAKTAIARVVSSSTSQSTTSATATIASLPVVTRKLNRTSCRAA